ncbi:MAG: hypothetical protein PHV68_04525 [Candidatus Gastranaerophilales bacterium]|nr:hypothetical protein [Candidatus Gastranaerophilales bacterium]
MRKKAFSYMEILVTVLLMGLIVTIAIPQINYDVSNKKLYKTAYKILKTASGEIIASSSTRVLDSGYCSDFSNLVNKIDDAAFDCTSSDVASDDPNVVLTNKMRFYGLEGDFTTNPKVITVDVNGEHDPNVDDKDLLQFNIFENGFVEPYGEKESSFLHCKIDLNGYSGTKADVISQIEAATGWDSTTATDFVDNSLPGTIVKYTNYNNAKSIESAFSGVSATVTVECY